MIRTVLLLSLLFCQFSFASDKSLVFQIDQRVLKEYNLEALKKELPPKEVTIFNKFEKSSESYLTFNFIDLLNKIYGPDWKNSKEIHFICLNKYSPIIPTEHLKLKQAYLAFERTDGGKFNNIDHIKISINDLGPYYLVWENDPSKALNTHLPWIYQIKGINLVNAEMKIAPQTKNEKVQKGFQHFKIHCLRCHSVEGEGGKVAVDLSYPPVAEKRERKWLESYISNPQAMNKKSQMPPLYNKELNRAEKISEIVEYLFYLTPKGKESADKNDNSGEATKLNSLINEAIKK